MKIIFTLLFTLLIFAVPVSVSAAEILFEHSEQTFLSRDVVYERSRKVTSSGFLDVYILRIPLRDPNISIAPIESHTELGVRETAHALLSQANAIAGTNADFFGMAGSHTLSFGPVIADGQLISISAGINYPEDEFAAFFLDEDNLPMIRFIQPRIWFTVNGLELANIAAVNKVANFNRPIIITREGMAHTGALSARDPNLFKVMVANGVVTGVVNQPVPVPEDGFIVVMNPESYMRYLPRNWIGMRSQFEVFSNLGRGLEQIQTAVGGGGIILRAGRIVEDEGTVVTGRHPRTALGITQDWQHLILMVVDGRGHSIGASHQEMANLLLRHNVSEAMHLDGGGSSTMVARAGGRGTPLQVVNRVSDGSQRRVINALGVFDNSIPGEINELVLMPYERYIPRGGSVSMFVYGLDLYLHRIGVNQENVRFSAYNIDDEGNMRPASGTWQGNVYMPDRPGPVHIRADYGTMRVGKTYLVQDIVALQFETGPIRTMEGANVDLRVSGITVAGANAALSPEAGHVQFTVSPTSLGFVENNVFIPRQSGVGYLTATMGSVQAHLPVTVGGRAVSVAGFDTEDIIYMASPPTLTGRAERNQNVIVLQYIFDETEATQAAYVAFAPPLPIPDNPFALRLMVHGDNSGNWLRGRVTDAEGNSHNIDFSTNIDFEDWQALTAMLPGTGPYTLDRIYVVAAGHEGTARNTLFFYTLHALFPLAEPTDIPESTPFEDPIRTPMTAVVPGNAHDFSLSISGDALAYSFRREGEAAVLQMTAAAGGLFASDRSQWGRFIPEIEQMGANFVIIRMDNNPLRFNSGEERELFHFALRRLQEAGRMVFVVSNTEETFSFTLRDGIRYIDLGNGGETASIHFRIMDGQIWYDF